MTETPNPYIVDADTMTGEMRPIRQAVLSLGSNVGERLATLQGAVDALLDTPEVKVVSVSPVYETQPVDAPAGSGDFLNAVLLLDTTLSVHTLLDRCGADETASGTLRAPSTSTSSWSATGSSTTLTSCCRIRTRTSEPSSCSHGSTWTPTAGCPESGTWPTCSLPWTCPG
jgi:hypothetical protein